jgi:hypothetical protein
VALLPNPERLPAGCHPVQCRYCIRGDGVDNVSLNDLYRCHCIYILCVVCCLAATLSNCKTGQVAAVVHLLPFVQYYVVHPHGSSLLFCHVAGLLQAAARTPALPAVGWP